ncbi:hypothetical protein QE430_003307 [Microbacterium testaceum]|uniref:hypothetical protein n=1 Tax=Microbacterium testaceum TaxID=2033 RepID=UPI00278B9F9F|nr:hypothetical protein [Microbacterium testaceum]MDQ1175000.1 hypothetical protein [Microbacterium testaceum]
MKRLAYIDQRDWPQPGVEMRRRVENVTTWLEGNPPLFFVSGTAQSRRGRPSAAANAARYIANGAAFELMPLTDLAAVLGSNARVDRPTIVLFPQKYEDLDLLRELVEDGHLETVLVLVRFDGVLLRTWIESQGAVNLHTGQKAPGPAPVVLEAASMMVEEQYDGLESGRGKDAVVQLLRVFTAEQHNLDDSDWLRAFFAAGGDFRNAHAVGQFAREMRDGRHHRTRTRYVEQIYQQITKRVADRDSPEPLTRARL